MRRNRPSLLDTRHWSVPCPCGKGSASAIIESHRVENYADSPVDYRWSMNCPRCRRLYMREPMQFGNNWRWFTLADDRGTQALLDAIEASRTALRSRFRARHQRAWRKRFEGLAITQARWLVAPKQGRKLFDSRVRNVGLPKALDMYFRYDDRFAWILGLLGAADPTAGRMIAGFERRKAAFAAGLASRKRRGFLLSGLA